MNFEIRQLSEKDEKKWDEFVMTNSSTTFYHQIGWKKVVEETYKHKPIYLIAESETGEIVGILPMFLIKSIFFGKRLVSVPFAPYGGVCAADETIENAVVEEAKRITKECGADYLELRNLKENPVNLPKKESNVTFIIELNSNPEIPWKNLRKRVRGSIRKAIKSNLKTEMNIENVKDFYDIYAQNVRDLGSPVHSYRFIINLIREFPSHVNIMSVKYNEKIISSVFVLFLKDTIMPFLGGSLREYLRFSPNNFKYWELIKYGCENNYKYFDYGRSSLGTGSFDFKKRWGSEPIPLNYQYYLNKTTDIPDDSLSSPKLQKYIKTWKNLPLLLANRVGPIIRRNIP